MRVAIAAVILAACGGDDGAAKPDASIIGVPGSYSISGVVRYEDRPAMPDGFLGPTSPKIARDVTVSVIDDTTMATLAHAQVGDDGAFAFTFDGTGGAMLHVMATTSSDSPARPITVVHPGTQLVFGFGGASFPTGLVTTQDVLVTEASMAAQAFNIFDVLIDTMDHIQTDLGDPTPSPLIAEWEVGNQDGTYYDGAIHLLGADDDDGYDDTVILHESGHYIEDTEGRSSSNGGNHDGSPTDPRLAWSEGWATYWSMAVHGDPVYIDTNAQGGFSYDGDTTIDLAPMPAGPLDQLVSEDMVTEILWDLGDAGASDDDGVAGTHARVEGVEPHYLKSTTLRAVGKAGVDLVDFLDGWFVADGLGNCAAAKAIVTEVHKFPYDYAGPAGACP